MSTCTAATCPPSDSWCTALRACDAASDSCLVVPRCLSTPFLGCLEEVQKCVDMTGLTQSAPGAIIEWRAVNETTGVLFGAFLLVLVALLVGIVFQRSVAVATR